MESRSFIGRRRELSAMGEWLEAGLLGQPRIVLCGGEPGVGKTRLASELVALAKAKGVPTRWVRTEEGIGSPPYWTWSQALSGGRSEPSPPALLQSAHADAAGRRIVMFDAVTQQLVDDAAPAGLLLVLEDMHWADRPSLLLLRHMSRELGQARILIVATHRTVGVQGTDAWQGVVPDLLRQPVTRQVHVRGFSLAETMEYVAAASGGMVSERLAREIHRRSRGNPFFAGELARDLAEHSHDGELAVPASVLEVVGQRVARLSPDSQDFLASAAVLGEQFSVPVAASLVDRPVMACLQLLEESRAAGFVEPADVVGNWRFSHAIVRDAVEERVAFSERTRLHRAAAEAIERIYVGDLDGRLADLARHWSAVAVTGESAQAVHWATRAADEAMRALAYEEAADLYRLALGVGEVDLDDEARCRLLLRLAGALWRSSEWKACWAACREVVERARRSGRTEFLAEAALALEPVGTMTLDLELRRWCEEALAALGAAAEPSVRVALLARLAEASMYAGEDTAAMHTSSLAMTIAESVADVDAVVAALRARQLALSGPEHIQERTRLADRMIDAGIALRRPGVEMWGRLWRIDAHWERGELSEISAALPRLEWCTERVGGRMAPWHLLITRAALAQAQGRFPDALDLAIQAFELIRAVEHPTAFGAYMSLLGAVGHHIGHERTPVLSMQEGPGAPSIDPGEVRHAIFAHIGKALVLSETGRHEEADIAYRRAGPAQTWRPPPYFRVLAWSIGSAVAAALGDATDVDYFYRRLEEERGRHAVAGAGTASYCGPVELYLGHIDSLSGRLDRAERELSAASTQCRAIGAAGFAIEADCELAEVLRRRDAEGDRERARRLASQTATSAERLGMVPWSRRAAKLRDREETATGVSLSLREMEVAELVAKGSTNQQIAETLFVSLRTAQTHVHHILAKLGFSNRSQIASWVTARSEAERSDAAST